MEMNGGLKKNIIDLNWAVVRIIEGCGTWALKRILPVLKWAVVHITEK